MIVLGPAISRVLCESVGSLMPGRMTEGKLALCRMTVFKEFAPKMTPKIEAALNAGKKKFELDLTGYAQYCVQLLGNNGWSLEEHSDEIFQFLWDAVPATILTMMHKRCSGEWKTTQTSFAVVITVL